MQIVPRKGDHRTNVWRVIGPDKRKWAVNAVNGLEVLRALQRHGVIQEDGPLPLGCVIIGHDDEAVELDVPEHGNVKPLD